MPTAYTLYIDESSDFISGKKPWVISGVLCPFNKKVGQSVLLPVLQPVFNQYNVAPYSVSTVGQLHLSEIRIRLGAGGLQEAWARANAAVLDIENVLFSSLENNGKDIHLFAAVNEPPRSGSPAAVNPGAADLARQRNYLAMLLDLIAMAHACLPHERMISHIDVVIATRNGMTTPEHLYLTEEMLQTAAHMGLAARGIADLLRDQRMALSLERASQSAGLAIADAVAHVTYRREEPGESVLYAKLVGSGRLQVFESLGGYTERRANIAARDGDLMAAIHWAASVRPNHENERRDAMLRSLIERLTAGHTVESARSCFEGVIERLWRQAEDGDGYDRLYGSLQLLESALDSLLALTQKGEQAGDVHQPVRLLLRFRIRNFMLAVSNHRGDSSEGARLYHAQQTERNKLPGDPANFGLLLDHTLLSVEYHVNDLEFEEAATLGRAYRTAAGRFDEAFLSLEIGQSSQGKRGRTWLRGETTFLRTQLLALAPEWLLQEGIKNSDSWDTLETLLSEIARESLPTADASRLRNYRLHLLLKRGKWGEALQWAREERGDVENPFDTFWTARVAADALLSEVDGAEAFAQEALRQLQQKKWRAPSDYDHPVELIHRERGLLERLIGSITEANVCYDSCERLYKLKVSPKHPLPTAYAPAAIWTWLRWVAQMHTADLNQEVKLPPKTPLSPPVLRQYLQDRTGRERLLIVRAASPY